MAEALLSTDAYILIVLAKKKKPTGFLSHVDVGKKVCRFRVTEECGFHTNRPDRKNSLNQRKLQNG